MRVLAFADAALAREASQHPMLIEDVPGLQAQLAELLVAVVTSELPEDARELVVEHLTEMISALERMEARTTWRFRRAAEAFLGVLEAVPRIFDVLKADPVGKTVLAAIAAVVLTVVGPTQIDAPPPLELPAPNTVIVQCIDRSRLPALPPGSSEAEHDDEATSGASG